MLKCLASKFCSVLKFTVASPYAAQELYLAGKVIFFLDRSQIRENRSSSKKLSRLRGARKGRKWPHILEETLGLLACLVVRDDCCNRLVR